MSINKAVVYLMVLFMALGGLDRIFGGKLGLSKGFEEGILAMGSLALSMLGMISLAPVLAKLLKPVVVPVYKLLGADPAMFAGTILANDMGGATLAQELAESAEAGQFGGLIVGSMLGATLVFTIPVALELLPAQQRGELAQGVLAGMIAIPLGSLVGGLAAGFPLLFVLRNLIPIALIALLVALGLWKAPGGMVKGFQLFGKGVVALITLGLVLAIAQELTGFTLLPGMTSIEEGIAVVGEIALVLAGAFPLVFVITKVFQKPLLKLGKLLGINDKSAAGLVSSLANVIPMLQLYPQMDRRGRVVNVAFAVSAGFVFGDHLGFTAGVDQSMILPMILGKLTGGIAGAGVGVWMTREKE